MEQSLDFKKKESIQNHVLNSPEWWEDYFSSGLWEDFSGGGQTMFFIDLVCANLDGKIASEIISGAFSICDVGCAQGEGVAYLKEKFSRSKVTGIDISRSAVEKAIEKFPQCNFKCGSLADFQEKYDVIFSSNVLEHIKEPEKELGRLAGYAEKYIILMVPFCDETGEETHINKFEEDFFKNSCPNGFELISLKTIDTSSMDPTYWPGKQALAIYRKKKRDKGTGQQELIAKPETWDNVAETYRVEMEDGDHDLANNIETLLKMNGLQAGDTLIEMGCGSGHLSACLAQKGYRVTLLDFSRVALEKAKLTFERYGLEGEFILGDLFHVDDSIGKYDFAWNSGVMEHFGDKEIITLMKNIGSVAEKGILYLVPNSNSIAYLLMRARLMADDEWIYGEEYLRRDYETILQKLGYGTVRKNYISTAAISSYQMWKAEREQGQISELYKFLVTEKMLPEAEGYLVAYFASNQKNLEVDVAYAGNTVEETRLFDLISKKLGYEEMKVRIGTLLDNITSLNSTIEQLNGTIEQNKTIMEELRRNNGIISEEKRELALKLSETVQKNKQEVKALEERNTDLLQELKEVHTQLMELEGIAADESLSVNCSDGNSVISNVLGKIKDQETVLNQQEETIRLLNTVLQQKDELADQAQQLCNHFATGKLMQLNHFLFRLKGQYLKGSKEDKAGFRQWLKGRFKKTNRSLLEGERYNPWMVINEKLNELKQCQPESKPLLPVFDKKPEDVAVSGALTHIHLQLAEILNTQYTSYDVIMLSVIDYDFRHQRPQHFADRFAENGHRVFYINANFVRNDSAKEISKNLFTVDFRNTEHNAIYTMDGEDTLPWMKEKLSELVFNQGIRDAVVVVDYPNWVYAAEFLRAQYGFKIVTDYMDDYTGFLNTSEDFLKRNCVRLLSESDLVVTSSQFLYEVAGKYADEDRLTIIRNGTEVEHFYKAAAMPAMPHDRKIIGYYGAVAHWFDWEKVCYLAEKLPMCDIVIIGEVTEHRQEMEKHANIKLLGEKKYKDLPEHLAYFDVCLIPFDTSTDLIKATNPVKFYEYLSAGKKIVATEIPELMPYRDKYVYMSNDNERFLRYVTMCLEGKDSLEEADVCIGFARENDWQKRFENFANACVSRIPSVSIIVLTYNNLKLNRICINSILENTAYPDYELVIVDNNSTDGTVEYLKDLEGKEYPQVKVIYNEENVGFAGGNNIGMQQTRGEYVLLLNNDTVVTRGWITNLTKHLENDEKYGMCGAITNSIGNEAMVRANYKNMKTMREFAYSYTASHMGEEYLDTDRLAMFCTLIRRTIIEEHGALDQQYKIGMFEDDDYAQTVMAAGYKLVIAEDSFVHHVNNASFKKIDDETYHKIFEENKALFEKKWNKKWRMPSYREGVTWDLNKNCRLDELD